MLLTRQRERYLKSCKGKSVKFQNNRMENRKRRNYVDKALN